MSVRTTLEFALHGVALMVALAGAPVRGYAQQAVTRDETRRTSLAEVLAYADRHAPLITVAEATLSEGEAARIGAEPLLTRGLGVEIGFGPRVQDQGTLDWDALVAISQPLELAGQRGARLGAASATGERLAASLERVRWEVHRRIHFAFHEAIEARVRREATERWLALAEAVLAIARGRAEAGEAGELEASLADAERARALQQLVQARHAYEAAVLTICEIAGWPPAHPPHPAGDLHAPLPVLEEEALVARALESHPAIAEREAAIREARARAELADREAWPQLDLGVILSREGAAGSPANYIALGTLSVAVPVWQQNAAERARARAAERISEAELDALRASIAARVMRAHEAVRSAAERVAIFETQVLPSFERSLDTLQIAYQTGAIPAPAIAAAREQLLAVQADALDAFAEYHRALAELESEVGAEVIVEDAHHVGPREAGGAE